MNEKTIILPDREEMLKRLLQVDADSHKQEQFYPILLKQAERRKVASGVVLMLVLAINDYTKGLADVMKSMLYRQIPGFIDALVDDADVAIDAKNFWSEVCFNVMGGRKA